MNARERDEGSKGRRYPGSEMTEWDKQERGRRNRMGPKPHMETQHTHTQAKTNHWRETTPPADRIADNHEEDMRETAKKRWKTSRNELIDKGYNERSENRTLRGGVAHGQLAIQGGNAPGEQGTERNENCGDERNGLHTLERLVWSRRARQEGSKMKQWELTDARHRYMHRTAPARKATHVQGRMPQGTGRRDHAWGRKEENGHTLGGKNRPERGNKTTKGYWAEHMGRVANVHKQVSGGKPAREGGATNAAMKLAACTHMEGRERKTAGTHGPRGIYKWLSERGK
eukprot:2304379-Pleurochrysis_carterae.AAC.1